MQQKHHKYNKFELHRTMDFNFERSTANLYHQPGDMSLRRPIFTIPDQEEVAPPMAVRVSAMNAEQLQQKTGCLMSLSLCQLAAKSGQQAEFLDCFEQLLGMNEIADPTWKDLGYAIHAQENPYEIVWHTMYFGPISRTLGILPRVQVLANCPVCYTAYPSGARCIECNHGLGYARPPKGAGPSLEESY